MIKLQRFISHFLEFSRLADRHYKPVPGPYNIEQAIYVQMEMTRLAAENKKIQINFEYKQEDLPIIDADGPMIDRVLSNLLDNAVKYTDTGGTVTIKLTNHREDVLVEVADTGLTRTTYLAYSTRSAE